MDIIEGLVYVVLLIILAIITLYIISHYLSKKGRLSEEMKKAIDQSAADYNIKSLILIGNKGIPSHTIKGKIRAIPNFSTQPENITLIRIEKGIWPFNKTRYIKLLASEHTDITPHKPIYIATTSFLPLGNTGFEITPNYPMGTAVQQHGDQTLPYAMKQTTDAYGQLANKMIELNLTHQETMERGGGLVKIMSNVKDSVLGAIPKPPPQPPQQRR